ncbi:MAG TPA: methyltransferase domain-containing protein [Verrucomicrobiae bacterium]
MTHDFDGKKYEKASAHQKAWGAKLIAELDLDGGEHILDLGCGDGVLTEQLAEIVPAGEVVGIDSSQGMIEVARQRQRDNLRFVLMNINDLNFREQFEVVFSNATLHWVRDHQRLYRNVKQALRPEGVLRFNFAGDGNCSQFFRVIREAMLLDGISSCFDVFQWPWYMPVVGEYDALVQRSGLRDLRVWGENADRFFPDADAMVKWIDQPSLVPFLPCVVEGDRSRFRDFVVRRMLETTRQPDGRCFETFRRVNVFARK